MATKDKKRRDDWIRSIILLLFGLYHWLLYFIRDDYEFILALIPSLIAFLAAWYFSPRRKQAKEG